jgi:hypothetical protein
LELQTHVFRFRTLAIVWHQREVSHGTRTYRLCRPRGKTPCNYLKTFIVTYRLCHQALPNRRENVLYQMFDDIWCLGFYLSRLSYEDKATLTGLEPATSAVTGRRSNQLSYKVIFLITLLCCKYPNLLTRCYQLTHLVSACQAHFHNSRRNERLPTVEVIGEHPSQSRELMNQKVGAVHPYRGRDWNGRGGRQGSPLP